MTERYSLQDAQAHLEELIEEALHGKQVFIQGANNKIVQLIPTSLSNNTRRAGSARGLVKFADDFDAPLTDFNEYTK